MLKKRFFKTKNEVEITFEIPKGDLESAYIVGEFNDWQAEPMRYNRKTKNFTFKLRLPKSKEFQFRYIVNETEWHNDAEADSYVGNDYGSSNCVVSTYESQTA
ncbi:isoamylase early set domain-containing protein [Thaumasiovibrio sp. DFM-14]|uniref:isoamylase early set domain-containing protein n=1 Tax=Thaumasiovibrio sp. DFM-14 TaxID=3384792 RepID=UPI0039A3EA68